VSQHDRGYEKNGLKDIIERYQHNSRLAMCRFDDMDIERHPVIETILRLYQD
jgi:phosphate starvation-inducible protein PhoH